ncbi:MAG: exodeoxyribonuclease VII large subunit [Ruminococcaceae bacterium]|nr:exodeoxyribonuclease VII large subunit [Oscillospiraceae bacterium]
MANKVFSVSELNNYIKDILDEDVLLSAVYVSGELSNYKIYPSGHHYFTMKDRDGALKCVMFKGAAYKIRFRPENGMKVIAFGRISVFPRDGAYQFYVTQMIPDGVGDLSVAFEQLKRKLYEEGLFDQRFKKPIPRYPKRIAVITSSAGAAVRDVIRVLGKRYPIAKVIVMPVRVQGVEAPAEIAGALRYANDHDIADVIITGRGGGSIEELWAFNEEIVARAIFASRIPVISAVGHEPDVTISDFVADLRAATPSNGAELCVPDQGELREYLSSVEVRMAQALDRELTRRRQRLEDISKKRVLASPMNYIEDRRVALDHIQSRLSAAGSALVAAGRHRFIGCASKLDALSPLKVLGRGYSIAMRDDGKVIKSAKDVETGDKISLHLKEDIIICSVEENRHGKETDI